METNYNNYPARKILLEFPGEINYQIDTIIMMFKSKGLDLNKREIALKLIEIGLNHKGELK